MTKLIRAVATATALLAFAVALSGCAGLNNTIAAIQGYSITQGQLDAARTTYDGTVLAPLHRYAVLPRCGPGKSFSISAPCHDKEMLKKLSDADIVAGKAFSDTQDMITSGNSSGSVAAWKSLQIAIDSVKGLLAASGASML
ncbi:hypothetical protein [Bradyrhizobium sp. 174]|uniref:hypothetical protein n=1 Tax=Bradyrhizobium sp. 174 TaxID=2782645 RepID=UPI001FFBAC9F|nr:hypothetical protein [Bradyrhizobium sp. 174]MCK1577773.1 hypothetical protein [Bradyrhizobium sp. 174]